eukprot:6731785-Lingulodinium_polyedra.AAC.1
MKKQTTPQTPRIANQCDQTTNRTDRHAQRCDRIRTVETRSGLRLRRFCRGHEQLPAGNSSL